MNKLFVSSGRITCVDQAVSHDLENTKLDNRQFVRLVAKKKRFVGCDFAHSTFEACYIRKCTFDSCNFSGCRFDKCQLPGTSFEGCRFDYATFEKTVVEPEILRTGFPGYENLQMRFARTLRTNYQALGNSDAANEAILVELAATKEYLRKAAFSKESYYRAKYKGLRRAEKIYEYTKFRLLDIFWGNGEKVSKLILTLFFILICMTTFDVLSFRDPGKVGHYVDAFVMAPQILLGIVTPTEYGSTYLSVVAFIRLVAFALLVSIILKRFHRR
jgi:Pentapeptide repeats (9 copies)